jgi:hypothetical protein
MYDYNDNLSPNDWLKKQDEPAGTIDDAIKKTDFALATRDGACFIIQLCVCGG